MSTKDDDKRTPEDLFDAWSTNKTSWNIVRVFRVVDGRRGAWRCDISPELLPDVRAKLAEQLGPGLYDLELAARGKNTKGSQCRVEIELDLRSPAAQMQANGNGALVPTNVYPGSAPAAPAWPYPFPPPWMQPQQQGPSAEVAALMASVNELKADARARNDAFMQGLMRDILLERHKAGNVMLQEQKETFKQALELGRSIRGGGGSGGGSWSDPAAVLPVLDRAAKVFDRYLEKRATQSNTQLAPVAPEERDQTAVVVAFCKASVLNKVHPKAALEQLRAIVGDATMAELIANREQFANYFVEHPEVQPLLGDAYATQWVRDALVMLDDLDPAKRPAPSTTPTPDVEVIPPAPGANGEP